MQELTSPTDKLIPLESKLVYVETSGKWQDCLIVDGRVVPNIRISCDNLCEQDRYILVDNRFAIKIANDEELERWGWFLANAMAIAAGWTCFGDEEVSRRYNPYGAHAPVVADYVGITSIGER